MPVYEYRCRRCGEVFERLLPMGAADPVCPGGHADVARLLSVFAQGSSGESPGGAPLGGGGGCCGGACGCG